MKDRFAKLAGLTRGAALLTLSASAGGAGVACTKNDPAPPPVAAGTIAPDPAGADVDAGGLQRRKFPMPNAMRPGTGWRVPADGGPVPPVDGGDGQP